jgi:hypothetical protein
VIGKAIRFEYVRAADALPHARRHDLVVETPSDIVIPRAAAIRPPLQDLPVVSMIGLVYHAAYTMSSHHRQGVFLKITPIF